jgi:hypothetical protein
MNFNPLHRRHHAEPWKGLVSGLAGGVAGTLAMVAFRAGVAEAAKRRARRAEDRRAVEAVEEGHTWTQTQRETEAEPDAPTEALSRPAAGELAEHHARAALAVRYGLGTSFGALYGLACEWHADLGALGGAPLGAAVMLLTDEVALPLSKLSPSPLSLPAAAHGEAFAAHVLYGLVCEATRRQVRGLLA